MTVNLQLSYNDMTFILEVARTGSLSAASKGGQYERGSPNRKLSDLEMRMGVKVFERDQRGTVPTEAGQVLLSGLRRAVLELQQTQADVEALLRQPLHGQLRLAVTPMARRLYLPRLLADFAQRYPQVTYDMTVLPAADCQKLLNGRMVHVALLEADPDDVRKQNERSKTPFPATVLGSYPLCVAAMQPLTLAQLPGLPYVQYPYGDDLQRQLRRWWDEHLPGCDAQPHTRVGTLDDCAALVELGAGYAFVPVPVAAAIPGCHTLPLLFTNGKLLTRTVMALRTPVYAGDTLPNDKLPKKCFERIQALFGGGE